MKALRSLFGKLTARFRTRSAPPRRIEPELVPIEDVPGLPRVLLIGDSISMGYTFPVRELLSAQANIHRVPTNGRSTRVGLLDIDAWLGSGKWDVIHFNWGIHDLTRTPEGVCPVPPGEYESNLRVLVAKLKRTGAKLIWATTTPIRHEVFLPERPFGDVVEYNAIAWQVMDENDIAINDLYEAALPRAAELQIPAEVHFTSEGSRFLGELVATHIATALRSRLADR